MDLTCCRVLSSHHVADRKGRDIHRALLPPHPPGDLSMDTEPWTWPVCQQEPAPFPFSSLCWIIPSSYQAAVDKWKTLPLGLSITSNVRFNHLCPEAGTWKCTASSRQLWSASIPCGGFRSRRGPAVEAGSFFSSCTVLGASDCPPFYSYKARHRRVNQPAPVSQSARQTPSRGVNFPN